MKADDLSLSELIQFGRGRINLYGRRLVLHDAGSFAQLRRELIEMIGTHHARCVLTRFGFCWGQADAAAMLRVFDWKDPNEWLKAGPKMHEIAGVSNVEVRRFEADRERGRFDMQVLWKDSIEAEQHVNELGRADDPVCWTQTGYASGYATSWLGTNVYFIECDCRGKGDAECTAIGKDEKSWGAEIAPYLRYFSETDHIQEKIALLTEQLARQTEQLIRQSKRIERYEGIRNEFFTQVHSERFKQTLELADCVADFDSSVLITGESGTGKEMLARYIHRLSKRAEKIFLAVNCSSLTETLLESELFGHKTGSFTGAVEDRIGLFEQADGGTLLLDEVGDISPAMQAKLLRVLQEKEIMRVGESVPRKIDVRIIAATNRNLPEAVRAERFREDLYYRLGVVEIEIPALRDRTEDIVPLARHFVSCLQKELAMPDLRLDARCLDYLTAYRWPGNVRELENVLERSAILSRNATIVPKSLPPSVVAGGVESAVAGSGTLAELERRHIKAVLGQTRGNRTKAAEILGISPTTLWRKLKEIEE